MLGQIIYHTNYRSLTSYDTRLYSKIYNEYYIVPCGGCNSVIARVKAMRDTEQLHDLECFGIIDRDYRSKHEIDTLKGCVKSFV